MKCSAGRLYSAHKKEGRETGCRRQRAITNAAVTAIVCATRTIPPIRAYIRGVGHTRDRRRNPERVRRPPQNMRTQAKAATRRRYGVSETRSAKENGNNGRGIRARRSQAGMPRKPRGVAGSGMRAAIHGVRCVVNPAVQQPYVIGRLPRNAMEFTPVQALPCRVVLRPLCSPRTA